MRPADRNRVSILLLAIVAIGPVVAQQTAIAPPDTDFSRFQKYPWKVSRETLEMEAAKTPSENRAESKVPPYTLPDPFKLSDGTPVRTKEVWERQRRAELLALFRSEIYGDAPSKPDTLAFRTVETDRNRMGGKATFKRVAISFRLDSEPFTFHLKLFVPNRRGKAPVFLLLNNRPPDNTDPSRKVQSQFWPAEYVIARGYAIAAIDFADEVEPDKRDATTGVRTFYRQHGWSELTWGAIGAWAWSGSRAMDYFETDPDIDPSRVAVIGHSRGGKTSLWAGAQDTRFALVCANDSGESGTSLSRRNFGETIAQITQGFPYWFSPRYATYAGRENSLPVDQHELIALVAPRAYHGGDATQDFHADPRGSWLALVEASNAWQLYGRPAIRDQMPLVNDLFLNGPMAYHIREGGHNLMTFDWKLYLDHADAIWK